jgi:hypothetical protein
MKGTILGLVLLVFACTGSSMAKSGNRWSGQNRDWRRANHGHHDPYRDNRGGSNYRDTREDERAIDHDRWEIRQDMRRGDYAAARREREEMRERERDLRRDRRSDWTRYTGWAWH